MKITSNLKIGYPVYVLLSIGASAENTLLMDNFCNPGWDHILSYTQNSYAMHQAAPESNFDYHSPKPKKTYKMKVKVTEKRRGTPSQYE